MSALTDRSYNQLKTKIGRILQDAAAHKPVATHLVEAYWTVGKLIADSEVLDSAAYGDAVFKSLSEDLAVDQRTLQRSVVFFEGYAAAPSTGLGWSHYRELLTISDAEERKFYEELAVTEQLSRDRLVLAISSDVYSEKNRPGRTVRLRRPADYRYLFEATLVRVIDGDTMLFDVDVGFEVIKRQRVRLAKVNAFSAGSKKGQRATDFVVQKLCFCDRIVLKTRRADLHGRYVADVFYSTRGLGFLETFDEGHYLNQQLLDQKLAMLARR